MENGIKKVTIYDIAQEAGISASQVSRAISGKGYVSEANRAKVEALIKKYNYKPNALAQKLQKGKSNMLGFLVPHISAEYFANTYYEFEREMVERGYITVVFNGKSSLPDELKVLQRLEEIRVDAVVIMGGNLDRVSWRPQYVEAIQNLNNRIPCVLGSERAEELNCAGVYTDIDAGIGRLMKHLAERGHQKLGILGGLESIYPSQRVKASIKQYARQYGMEVRPQWCVNSSYGPQDGDEAMRILLKEKELPTAVCCINDDIAAGAMGAAMDAGLKIPQDIAFTGYGGTSISKIFRPKMTTVQFDFRTFGSKLAEAVEHGIAGEGEKELTLVKPGLEIRESTLDA